MPAPHVPAVVLVGPASLDRYLATGEELPGGGALNMACHWSGRGVGFELVTRVGAGDRALFGDFFERHRIATTAALYEPGASCSVDVVFRDDRQPWMDNFVEGVWSDFRFTDAEIDVVRSAASVHLVLVDVVDRELGRVAPALTGVRLSADFLSFRHFTVERFVSSFASLEVGFIGWPGPADDPVVAELAHHAVTLGNVLVITFGSHGVRVVDGRAGGGDHWFDVEARPVTGTTIGCGDAFIAAFLESWYRDGDLRAAVDSGRELGADATSWERALPDAAYAAG